MKKIIPILLILFAGNFLISSSCNKNDDPPAPVKTKTQLLTQSTWKFKSATANGSDVSNQAPPFDACRKDNILTFTAAGSGNVNEGPTSCSPPEGTTFTWSFLSTETVLNVSSQLYPNAPNDYTLVSLTETELIISFPYNFTPSISVIVVVTFQH
jgi:Lipocalin-like domain